MGGCGWLWIVVGSFGLGVGVCGWLWIVVGGRG